MPPVGVIIKDGSPVIGELFGRGHVRPRGVVPLDKGGGVNVRTFGSGKAQQKGQPAVALSTENLMVKFGNTYRIYMRCYQPLKYVFRNPNTPKGCSRWSETCRFLVNLQVWMQMQI